MSQNAQGTVWTQGPTGLQEAMNFLLDGPALPGSYTGPYARVKVSYELTIPTGPYQNVKPTVMLELPVHPSRIEEAYAFVKDWVDGKLVETRHSIEQVVVAHGKSG